MSKWTDAPASTAEQLPRTETRNLELSAVGADGRPLVITIRRIPIMDMAGFARLKGLADNDPQVLDAYRMVGKMAVVAPKFDFSGDPANGPQWDALAATSQMEILKAVTEYTLEGMKEAGQWLDAFRSGQSGSADAGDSDQGRVEAGEPAPASE